MEYVREAIFSCADENRDIFEGCRPKLYKKWSQLYKLPLLREQDYEDASIDDLIQIIEPKWQHFLEEILPIINNHLMEIKFDDVE